MGTMERKHLTEPSPSDWDRWEQRLLEGEEPSEAARAEGQTCSNFRRNDPGRHAAALILSREARGYYVDRLVERDVVELDDEGVPRYKAEASDAMKALHAKRWQPEYGGTGRLEIEHTGTVHVEHERRLTLADVAGFARTLDGPRGGDGRALPVAGVVAEPSAG